MLERELDSPLMRKDLKMKVVESVHFIVPNSNYVWYVYTVQVWRAAATAEWVTRPITPPFSPHRIVEAPQEDGMRLAEAAQQYQKWTHAL